jgi:hypothetical protein
MSQMTLGPAMKPIFKFARQRGDLSHKKEKILLWCLRITL